MRYSNCRASCAALIVAGTAGILAAPAHASCIRSSEREYVARADAVFVGRVLSASRGTARFRVLSVRKGRIKRGSSVRVYARPYPSSVTLDWSPRPGQRWRVYVAREGRRWITNDCQGTRRVT